MKSQRSSLDMFTILPQAIIETILCLLPIEEAARTSILSRQWRYKWTTIPKLAFGSKYGYMETKEKPLSKSDWRSYNIERGRRNMDPRCKLLYAIHQVLLLRQGPIHEFSLLIFAHHPLFEIDQIILHLSKNHTLKKFTLNFGDESSSYTLPLSAFSLHHLTDLCLEYCDIKHKPIFNGFGSLTSLTLRRLTISKESLLHLLSNSPSLKRLSLLLSEEQLNVYNERPSIMELFKCIPVIEQFTTWRYFIQWLDTAVLKELPASLIHLKYVCIKEMCFADSDVLTFLGVLMKCSPNLEKMKLQIGYQDEQLEPHKLEEYSIMLKAHSDVWLEHLIELKIQKFGNLKPELEFVKLILARSPNLKKVMLRTHIHDKKELLELLKILLRAPRVSHVEIVVEHG